MKWRSVKIGILCFSIFLTTIPHVTNSEAVVDPTIPWNIVGTVWGSITNPIDVGPGDENIPLSVIIQYTGSKLPVTGISVELLVNQSAFTTQTGNNPISYPTLLGGVGVSLPGTFNPGDIGVVQFILGIKSNITINQPNQMDIRIMYFENNLGNLTYEFLILKFEVQVLGKSEIIVDLQGSPIMAEQENEVTISLTNIGTATVNKIFLDMTLPPPLILSKGTGHWEFDQIMPNNKQELNFSVFAPKISGGGTYQLILLLTYQQQSGVPRSMTHYGGLVVEGNINRPTSDLQVEFSISNITAGRTNNLTINLNNQGASNVYDVNIGIELPPPLIITGTDNNWHYNELLAENLQNIPVQIFAPEISTGNTFPIIITMSFKDDTGVLQMASRTLGLLVIGDIDMLVYELVPFPFLVPINGNFTLSGSILNRGNVEAMYGNVTLVEDDVFQIGASSTYYVGQIDPNAPIPFAVSGFLKPNVVEGVYPLKIELTYHDNFGSIYSLNTTFPITVIQKIPITTDTSDQSDFIQRITDRLFRPIPLLFGALLIIILWRYFRKSEEEL